MSSVPTHGRGRPLIFLFILAVGWISMRFAIVSVWPATSGQNTFIPSVAALEGAREPTGGEEGHSPLATTLPAPERNVDSVGDQQVTGDLVEGLEPVPPADLEAVPTSLETAQAHNALWMAASGVDDEGTGVASSGEASTDHPR